jgi:hypothetical protein
VADYAKLFSRYSGSWPEFGGQTMQKRVGRSLTLPIWRFIECGREGEAVIVSLSNGPADPGPKDKCHGAMVLQGGENRSCFVRLGVFATWWQETATLLMGISKQASGLFRAIVLW